MWHYEVKEREQFPGFLKHIARLLSRGMEPIAMLAQSCVPDGQLGLGVQPVTGGEEAAGVPVCV